MNNHMVGVFVSLAVYTTQVSPPYFRCVPRFGILFPILHILLLKLDGPLDAHHHYLHFYPHNQLFKGH